jgi:hypothetical protein
MLAGEQGQGVQLAMELLVQIGEAQSAPDLIDISAAHIDSCLYHGTAGLDFAKALVSGDARVRVPTTLNVSSLDLLHPDLFRGPESDAVAARELMDAYVAMDCSPTWTCAPYQLAARPEAGEQIAWGESNAIVFANSVLGARTERYGDFTDICCAVTGRAPNVGLHTDEGRLATLIVELDLDASALDEDVFYPLLGQILGLVAGTEIPVVVGLDKRAGEDQLKAVGAAAASSGAVAMFHAVGVTPEAPTLSAATGGRADVRTAKVTDEDFAEAMRSLSRDSGRLGAVSVGTPHFSAPELRRLCDLTRDRRAVVPFYVNTSRDTLAAIEDEGLHDQLRGFGATFVVDTCTYITPIMGAVDGVVLTNSGKWAYYAPGNLGVEVAFGSLEDCVESAVKGELKLGGMWR